MQPKHTARIATALGIVGLTVWWIVRGHFGIEVGDEVTFEGHGELKYVVVKGSLRPDSPRVTHDYVKVKQMTGPGAGTISWRSRKFAQKVRP